MRKILTLILVLGTVSTANAIVVRLSFDGVEPAPDSMDVLAGDTFKMYVISDTAGQAYGRDLIMPVDDPLSIDNVQSYSAAGSDASVSAPYTTALYHGFYLETGGVGVEAGKHFSFDVAIDAGAAFGDEGWIGVITPGVGDYVDFHVVPEPGTVLLLGLGGLVLLRRRRANKKL